MGAKKEWDNKVSRAVSVEIGEANEAEHDRSSSRSEHEGK
jgi:hypothetical protein